MSMPPSGGALPPSSSLSRFRFEGEDGKVYLPYPDDANPVVGKIPPSMRFRRRDWTSVVRSAVRRSLVSRECSSPDWPPPLFEIPTLGDSRTDSGSVPSEGGDGLSGLPDAEGRRASQRVSRSPQRFTEPNRCCRRWRPREDRQSPCLRLPGSCWHGVGEPLPHVFLSRLCLRYPSFLRRSPWLVRCRRNRCRFRRGPRHGGVVISCRSCQSLTSP